MCSNFQKAEGVFVNRSVSCLWSPLAPDLRSCPCVAAALSGSPAFCAGSWRGIQIQTAHVALKVRSMKNCRPVARLQILSENKESRPAGDQRILSRASGGKMISNQDKRQRGRADRTRPRYSVCVTAVFILLRFPTSTVGRQSHLHAGPGCRRWSQGRLASARRRRRYRAGRMARRRCPAG